MPDHAKLLAAEVDALRARLAEVEARLKEVAVTVFASCVAAQADAAVVGDVNRTEADSLAALADLVEKHRAQRLALAASQAEVRELREMVRELLPLAARGTSCAHSFNDPCAECRAAALLARPTSDTALRGLCERVGEAVEFHPLERVCDGHSASQCDGDCLRRARRARAIAAVNEVLGPGAAPIAAEIKEKE